MDTRDEKNKKKGSRVNRLLLLFHLFYYCKNVEVQEMTAYLATKNISVSHRTTMRDIQFLGDAGLIQAMYSKSLKAYVPLDEDGDFVPADGKYIPKVLPEKPVKRQCMEKIIRLCTLMTQVFMKEVENPYQWYRKRYPMLSERTRERDFKQLREIGYEVTYESLEGVPGWYYCKHPPGIYDELDFYKPPKPKGMAFIWKRNHIFN